MSHRLHVAHKTWSIFYLKFASSWIILFTLLMLIQPCVTQINPLCLFICNKCCTLILNFKFMTFRSTVLIETVLELYLSYYHWNVLYQVCANIQALLVGLHSKHLKWCLLYAVVTVFYKLDNSKTRGTCFSWS